MNTTMQVRNAAFLAIGAALVSSCATRHEPSGKVTVGAAANLTDVFAEIGRAFTAETRLEVVFSYGSTAELAQQIANGAPFDVFAAADKEHVDALVGSRKIISESRAVYAVGQLALWIPEGEQSGIKELGDLTNQRVRFIAVANPALAPYGQATIEALKTAGIWQSVQSRVVYSNSISQAKQTAASGNADAAFTAYSLVLHERGSLIKVDPHLYHPIEQSLAIVASSAHIEQAKQFCAFLLGGDGRAILTKSGYLVPGNGR